MSEETRSDTERRLRAELEALRQQNRDLNEQVKLLCRTEQRLYRSQGDLDRELGRVAALSELDLSLQILHELL